MNFPSRSFTPSYCKKGTVETTLKANKQDTVRPSSKTHSLIVQTRKTAIRKYVQV